MRILSVDDKAENRYLVEALLKGHGLTVFSAAHGAEALEILAREPVDCILSDILMPVMDGFELCRRLKADPRYCHIPFIVFTATYTGPQDEAFSLKIGAAKFLLKPCEPEVLVAAVREVLATVAAPTEGQTQPQVETGEEEVLKLYNERLVRKLEQKMLELEREIAARTKAEEVLRRSETNYRLLFHSIRDAILVSDIDRHIVNCNRAFVDLFGYTLDEVQGRSLLMLYEESERSLHLGEPPGARSNDPMQIHQVCFRRKDGQVFPGEVNLFGLFDEQQCMTGYIGLIRDVTQRSQAEAQRQQLEAQLRQAQKMESIGRLAGGVAHDYNNMLSIILGYAQMALNKSTQGQLLHDYLLQIVDAAQRSAEMTRKLLGFARKQPIVPREIDLNQTVAGMLKMLGRLIGERFQLRWQPREALWPVLIDPSQVDQILANLCVNARDAMCAGGTIHIATTMVTLKEERRLSHGLLPAGEWVVLNVADEGCGIEPLIQEQMFEPFFTTKEEGQGTGLGLATVYGIIQQNNGCIDVSSRPLQGTTISLYLPRLQASRQEVAGAETSIPRGQGETILLVEDEEGILQSTSGLLNGLGYTVLTATRPSEALRLAHAESGNIHLLLTDVVMPEMSGDELAQLLRTFNPQLPCLFMSGYADCLSVRGAALGAGECIRKPFSIKELATGVHGALHRQQG